MSDDKPLDLNMIRPPLNRAMRVLDRSLFTTRIPIVAARIYDLQKISRLRRDLAPETLEVRRLGSVQTIRDGSGTVQKILLLKPDIKKDDRSTWSHKLTELVQTSEIGLLTYDLELGYDYWNYDEIIDSILPDEDSRDVARGFNHVGHVAHFNLKNNSQTHKHLFATIVMDKNPGVTSVINKIEKVGADNPFRTFNYEVLAGSPDMNVETSEQKCIFRFNYGKVYWNSKLQGEHWRVTQMFKPGEAVADVMAGVGPFAVPAAKKKCFVWANDLNPDAYSSLEDAIQTNKVSKFARAFNLDGNEFIKIAPRLLLESAHTVISETKGRHGRLVPHPLQKMARPKTFSHFVMNLPATAIDFLPSFTGIYAGHDSLFVPRSSTELPLIHVHCFASISEGKDHAIEDIARRISESLGYKIKVGSYENSGEASVHDARDVAPTTRMFCATFRLPPAVAFAKV